MNISVLTVREIKEMVDNQLTNELIEDDLLLSLSNDPRAGVQKIYQQLQRYRREQYQEHQRLEKLFTYEDNLIKQGKEYIAGVDEAGRGPLAGPVVAAAVILPRDISIVGLNDSKKLSAAKREQLAVEIKEKALVWTVAEADVEEICSLNIYHASILAMKRAVEKLAPTPDYVLTDAVRIPTMKIPHTPIIGGDAISASIAAASIIAKTHRDNIMYQFHRHYPQYGFDKHKGYPTAEHIEKLQLYGPCPIHRHCFAPVAEVVSKR
ncbi:MAG: ribonuclease HII [Firmicutes bacterium]|nr:ribonuclease HII [Bacillota bacterium]